jgi:MFS superfamily sulfate permease-like transporter
MLISFLVMYVWQKFMAKKVPFLPSSFIVVITGTLIALGFAHFVPSLQLKPTQLVNIPNDVFGQMKLPDFTSALKSAQVWQNAVVICFVATLETLLSIEAIDKLDPYNRITPQNRELIAQGTGNFLSGLVGGLPITAVIVRSSANAEAGGRTKLSSISHGVLLLLVVVFATALINYIPYCVLAVILIRTGYNLAKPAMIRAVYRQGREQFMPFIITIVAILFTDLLIGVLIGFVYAIYFLIKHTYRAGYIIEEKQNGNIKNIRIELALNVSFLNKKKFIEVLDGIPDYSVLTIDGSNSVYIDQDILEIFQAFKAKAKLKHIELTMIAIPEVASIELH